MKDVFDQHSDMDRDGNVTGGNGKLLCLHNGKFDKTMIRTLVNTPFRDFNYFAQGVDDSDSDDLVFETRL